MLEFSQIQKLAEPMNAVGSEVELSRTLAGMLLSCSAFVQTDDLFSVLASTETGTLPALFCPMDVPGALTVADGERCRVMKLGDWDLTSHIKKTLILSDRSTAVLETDKEEKPDVTDLYLKNTKPVTGLAAKFLPDLECTDGALLGFDAATYALLSMTVELQREAFAEKTAAHFIYTAQNSSRRTSGGACAAYRLKPDFAIVLGSVAEKKEKPVLVIRDGKHYSHPLLIEAVKKVAKENKIEIAEKIFPARVTKAEEIAASCGIPTVTLALPKECTDGKEKVLLSVTEELKKIICSLLTAKVF